MKLHHLRRQKSSACKGLFLPFLLSALSCVSLISLYLLSNQVLLSNSCINNTFSTENPFHDIKSIKQSTDPHLQPVDCTSLLQDFRNNAIANANDNDATPRPPPLLDIQDKRYEKAHITLTTTPHPFYVSLHPKELDPVRYSVFEARKYYESGLSQAISDVFDRKRIGNYHEQQDTRTRSSPTERSAVKNRSIFLDVGANVGWFSLLAASHGAQVYTFEPNIVNMVRYCESVVLNGWDVQQQQQQQRYGSRYVVPYLKGVSDVHGVQQTFYAVDGTNPGSYSFSKNVVDIWNRKHASDAKEIGSLTMVSLDVLAEEQGWLETRPSIGFLKIDVEGLEAAVIRGATKLLQGGMVENVAMELKKEQKEEEKREIVRILYTAGYDLYKHGRYKGPVNSVRGGKYKTWEALADDIVNGVYAENVWFRISRY